MPADNDALPYHYLSDGGMRKLTVYATEVRPVLWVLVHIIIVHLRTIIICVNLNAHDYGTIIGEGLDPAIQVEKISIVMAVRSPFYANIHLVSVRGMVIFNGKGAPVFVPHPVD